jgi:HK97 family phage portal protein
MNFLQRAVAGLANSVGLQASSRDAWDGRWWGGEVIQSLAGQVVTNDTALQLDVIQSVLERLAGTVSTLPLMVFERTGEDSRRVAREHPLYRVLHTAPNRRQTAQEYRDEQQRHLAWWRNAYARIVPGEDPIDELDPIHPSRVTRVERGSDGWVYYTVQRLAPAMGHDIYREDEIWHIRKAPLTPDGLRGRPVWETARETIGKAQAVEAFGALYFANGGSGGGVLKHPGTFKSKEDEQDFLRSWREGGSGLNRHRDRLLKYGVDYDRFTVNNDEAQFLETLKEVGVKLCRLWNMPPHLVGMLDKATFSNIEQQSIEYVVHTLAPWIAAWEQAAARDLLIGADRERYFVEFNVAGLLRGDFKTRWQAYAWGRQWGWLSINDVRRLENMDPVADGDAYLQPLNMVPAGSAPPAGADGGDPKDPANA